MVGAEFQEQRVLAGQHYIRRRVMIIAIFINEVITCIWTIKHHDTSRETISFRGHIEVDEFQFYVGARRGDDGPRGSLRVDVGFWVKRGGDHGVIEVTLYFCRGGVTKTTSWNICK